MKKKPDPIIIALILGTLSIAIFTGVLSVYSGTSGNKEDLITAYTGTYKSLFDLPTSITEFAKQMNRMFGEEPIYITDEPEVNEDAKADVPTDNNILEAAAKVWNDNLDKGLCYCSPPNDSVGMDCSKYVHEVFKSIGVDTPNSSKEWYDHDSDFDQFQLVDTVEEDKIVSTAQPGDVLSWNSTKVINGKTVRDHHVQIYAGNGLSYSWGGNGKGTSKKIGSATYYVDETFPSTNQKPPHSGFKHTPCKIWRLK